MIAFVINNLKNYFNYFFNAPKAAMMNGYSDNSFVYFLDWLIAQGKDVYLAALRDPDSLADVETVKRFAQEVKESKGVTPRRGYYEEPRFEDILVAAHPV